MYLHRLFCYPNTALHHNVCLLFGSMCNTLSVKEPFLRFQVLLCVSPTWKLQGNLMWLLQRCCFNVVSDLWSKQQHPTASVDISNHEQNGHNTQTYNFAWLSQLSTYPLRSRCSTHTKRRLVGHCQSKNLCSWVGKGKLSSWRQIQEAVAKPKASATLTS